MIEVTKNIYLTEQDKERLEKVVATTEYCSNVEMLEGELERAVVVPAREIPADVVTMNSRVRFKDITADTEFEVTLVYPNAADFDRGNLSVLAPIGTALLGLRVGNEIEWPLPSGQTRLLKITSVLFQPEAEGQFHL